ncbi:Putative tRNA(Met) cytidine acetyltransferase [Rhizopus microsporus]|nr:Putative tRNA(Met) cytidine acetyltransferase [Rhizopus microsporus]
MVKKVVDSRVHTLIKNCVQTKHRSFFVIVGDKGRDQVVNLHWLLSQAQVTSRPSVLWCYKKELGFTSHRKKREAKIKKDIKRGIREVNQEDPFELFITVTNIRYAYYKETQKILGNTYGMCILQDFEAITPNTLARTIETVEGGGMVVLLLKSMSSLKQLYTMTMDVHSRYRTEAHSDVVARFNERFILSLTSCETCLVVDDELNVLPISMGKNVKPLAVKASDEQSPEEIELAELKESLKETEPVASLVKNARTIDQAKAIKAFSVAFTVKYLIAILPSLLTGKIIKRPGILKQMAGRDTMCFALFLGSFISGYKGILCAMRHFRKTQDKESDKLNAFVAGCVAGLSLAFDRDKRRRQSVMLYLFTRALQFNGSWLMKQWAKRRKAMHPDQVKWDDHLANFLQQHSGVALIQQLREQSRGIVGKKTDDDADGIVVGRNMEIKKTEGSMSLGGRTLKEVKLEEPIRYAPNDPVEKWLNKVLCLDANIVSKNIQGCPHPSECELYYVNRDTLFSYHPVSETFLQRMMSLYVASHYKNSPNDLQLMSDAPAHHLFVLLPPVNEKTSSLPDPLVVIQVCLEGEISRQTRAGFVPLYMRQTANDLTGEHTCVMIKALTDTQDARVANSAWLDAFARDFSKRFIHLLSYNFRDFTAVNALSVLDAAKQGEDPEAEGEKQLDKERLNTLFSPYDLKRLESYANNMVDYHVILDMIPTVAELYFRGEMPADIKLSGVQSAILLGIGLQRKSVDDLQKELSLASNQVLALFVKIVKKFSQYFTKVEEKAIEASVPKPSKKETSDESGKRDIADEEAWQPLAEDVDEDLEKAGNEVLDELKSKQRELIDSLDLSKYAIGGTDDDWTAAEQRVKSLSSGKKSGVNSVISVKNEKSSKKRKLESAQQLADKEKKRQEGKIKLSKKARKS